MHIGPIFSGKNQFVNILGSKVILAFYLRILQYNLLFSFYFDHSIQKQPKTAEYLISYTLCRVKNAFWAFLT